MTTGAAADRQRLQAVRAYGVAGLPRDSVLDDIVGLVARACETPMALVALVGSREQWILVGVGVSEHDTRASLALNEQVVESAAMLAVPDTGIDAAPAHAAGARFYAAAPLVTETGVVIGTLAVLDVHPRTLSAVQARSLETFAAVVMTRLEMRKQRLDTARAESALLELLRDQQLLSGTVLSGDSRYRMLFTHNPTPMWIFDAETLRFLAVNGSAVAHYGYSESEFLTKTIADIRESSELPSLAEAVAQFADGGPHLTTTRHRLQSGRVIDVEVTGDTIEFQGRPARLVVVSDITARLAADRMRDESDERFAMVLRASTAGLWDWNIHRGTLYVSPGFRELLGYGGSDVADPVAMLVETTHPDDRTAIERAIREHLATPGSIFDTEYRVRTQGGEYRWINARGQAVWDAHGTPLRMTGSVVDVTERRAAAEALRESEERFRLLSRATNDAIWDYDIAADTVWWNDSYFELFGYTRADTSTSLAGWTSRIADADRERVVQGVQAALESGAESWWDEYRYQKADGSQAYVLDRGYLIRDAAGRVTRMIGGMTDLTARREAEEQIAAQAALLDEAQDAILLTDLSNRVLFWNRGAERAYGWSAGEAIGCDIADLYQIDSAAYRDAHARLLDAGRWEGILEHRTREGDILTVETRLALTRDPAGKPTSILILSTDVTERRRTEAQLLRAQRLESIGTLAGGIAHDLNNLLAPMMLSVDLLRESCTDAESIELLKTLQLSASRGASLVQQVLSFARGVEGQRVPVSPELLVQEMQKIIRDSFARSIEVVVPPMRDIWLVDGDPTQLHQVLLNLSVNARDAMPNGGQLTIAVANTVIDPVYAANYPDAKPGDYVLIRVSDTGSGIMPAVRERIFEPFFSTKALGHGTGLGLSTTMAIVRSHGGFISLYSEPGMGTTFGVHLPASRSRGAARLTPRAEPAMPRGGGQTILVVDDEAPIRRVAQRTLERGGYRVITAENGAQAAEMYRQQGATIDLVLTDMTMPVMDGAELIALLRTLNPEVRIIASSGLIADEGVVQDPALPVTRFVAKPYTADTLLRAISDAL